MFIICASSPAPSEYSLHISVLMSETAIARQLKFCVHIHGWGPQSKLCKVVGLTGSGSRDLWSGWSWTLSGACSVCVVHSMRPLPNYFGLLLISQIGHDCLWCKQLMQHRPNQKFITLSATAHVLAHVWIRLWLRVYDTGERHNWRLTTGMIELYIEIRLLLLGRVECTKWLLMLLMTP